MSWRARWAPAATLMLVSVISYVDRNTLALLSPTILRETHLSATEYGFAVSAYSLAFMVGNPVWGKVLDRIGLRSGMIAAVAVWSMASTAHALAAGFWGFVIARAVLGFGEGAAAPGGLRTVLQTLPPVHRSRGIALTYSGGSAGAIITPLLIAPIAARWGWRSAFWFTGLIGVLWIAGWLVMSRRDDLRTQPALQRADALAGRPRFSDARLWAFLLGYSLGALPLGFVVYCSALYLNRVLGASQLTIGGVLWVPPLGSELGIFFWGFLADRLAVGHGKLAVISRLLPIAMLLSLPLALVPYTHVFALVLAQLFFAMFVASAFQLLLITYGSEVFAHEHAGYVGGIASGAYGAVLALLMPLFGRLFDRHDYALAFGLAALCPVIGWACFHVCTRRATPAPA